MGTKAKAAASSGQVIPAAAEESPILSNLLQLYAHDFSEFHNLDMGEDGRFGYRSLPLYWSELERHPFRLGGAARDSKLAAKPNPENNGNGLGQAKK